MSHLIFQFADISLLLISIVAIFTHMIVFIAVNDWLSSFEQRILPFFDTKIVLDDPEIVRLGKKVPNEYPCFKLLVMN